MSMRTVALVMDHGPKVRSLRLLLIALADRSDDNGICWPSRADLRARASMSDATITRALRALEADGWIQRQRRLNTSCVFRLNVARLRLLEAAKPHKPVIGEGFAPFPEETGAQAIEKAGSAHSDRGTAHGDRGTAHGATDNLSRTCQEPERAAARDALAEWKAHQRAQAAKSPAARRGLS